MLRIVCCVLIVDCGVLCVVGWLLRVVCCVSGVVLRVVVCCCVLL